MKTKKKESEDQALKREFNKCKSNPYYFATKYLTINGEPFVTNLSEKAFNMFFIESLPLNTNKS